MKYNNLPKRRAYQIHLRQERLVPVFEGSE